MMISLQNPILKFKNPNESLSNMAELEISFHNNLRDLVHFTFNFPNKHLRFINDFPSEKKKKNMKVVKTQIMTERGVEQSQSVWWKHLLAGGMAGAVSRTCTAPLDRIKITLQVKTLNSQNQSLYSTVSGMLREGGLTSFWRGNGINVFKVMPEMALKFTVYDQIKGLICSIKGNNNLDITDRFISGSIAGMVSQSLIFPLEVIKTRLVLRTSSQTTWNCIQDLFSDSKIFKRCFRGFVPNMIGIIPYAGFDLAIYETLKREYISRQSLEHEPPISILLLCGILSSSCGQVVSYPLNLVKTRFQATPVTVNMDSSLISAMRTIVITDGLLGLYRGLCANLLKVAPSVAIGYVVYEQARKQLKTGMC